jgi:hypothetical protein
MGTSTAAIVLTHNRPDLLRQTVDAISGQVDVVLIVDNASDPPVRPTDLPGGAACMWILPVPDQPPNLAALWNEGLRAVREKGEDPIYVAVLCDDADPPAGWFAAVTDAMAATGAVAGCSNPWGQIHEARVKLAPDRDIMGRMPGWAFVLDTRAGLVADQSMAWWWCDTDLDWQARTAGGMVMIGGFAVPNHRPNEYTNAKPELAARAGVDGQAFATKWGYAPW